MYYLKNVSNKEQECDVWTSVANLAYSDNIQLLKQHLTLNGLSTQKVLRVPEPSKYEHFGTIQKQVYT